MIITFFHFSKRKCEDNWTIATSLPIDFTIFAFNEAGLSKTVYVYPYFIQNFLPTRKLSIKVEKRQSRFQNNQRISLVTHCYQTLRLYYYYYCKRREWLPIYINFKNKRISYWIHPKNRLQERQKIQLNKLITRQYQKQYWRSRKPTTDADPSGAINFKE